MNDIDPPEKPTECRICGEPFEPEECETVCPECQKEIEGKE